MQKLVNKLIDNLMSGKVVCVSNEPCGTQATMTTLASNLSAIMDLPHYLIPQLVLFLSFRNSQGPRSSGLVTSSSLQVAGVLKGLFTGGLRNRTGGMSYQEFGTSKLRMQLGGIE